MPNRIIRVAGLVLIALLTLLPLAFKLIVSGLGIALPSSDLVLVNLVFVYAAIAGIITSAENKQLSLGVFTDKLPYRARRVIEPVGVCVTTAILAALFLASFSETFMAFKPDEILWGIPLSVVFAALPLMYGAMVAFVFFRRRAKLAAAIGLVIGFAIASGPVAGILYSVFKIQSVPFATDIFNAWIFISGKFLWVFIGLLVVGTVLGVPIFVVLSGVAYVAFSQGGGYVEMIPLEGYNILTDKSIAAIPLFTLAGYLLAEGSAGKRLLDVVKNSVGWIRGGSVIAAVIVATGFTTFTGASGVTILALGGLLTVILTGSGYSQDNAESLVTATGAIGMLFPPSLAIIIYGATNIFSVDIYALFKGAFIPGILMAVSMIVIGVMKDKNHTRSPFSARELAHATKESVAELLLPVAVIVGYFSGFFSLIETAAFTAAYAYVLEVFVRKDYGLKKSAEIALKSIPVAGGVLVIVGAAKGLAYFLIDAGIPFMLTDFVISVVHSKYVFLFLLNVLLLIVGCLMDLYSAILVVSPLIIPVAESFGINPVHTGVIFLTNLSLGFLTPPVGMNLFIASYTFEKPIMKIVRNILPWLFVQFIILMLVTYVPWFSTALL